MSYWQLRVGLASFALIARTEIGFDYGSVNPSGSLGWP